MIKKAVILAAGLGTRMKSVTNNSSKEMLLLQGKPIISFAIKEALESGCNEIGILIAPEKKDLENYLLKEKEKGLPIKIIYKEPKGLMDSISAMESFVANESFGMIFPDMLVFGKHPALSQLIKEFNKYKKPIIGLIQFNPKFGKAWRMEGSKINDSLFDVKLILKESTSNIRFFPRYVFPENTFKLVKNLPLTESEVPLLEEFIKTIGLQGILLEGESFDAGAPEGYLEAKKILDSL